MKILAKALERYDVDGLFFNMFGQPWSDYSGNRLAATGPCRLASWGSSPDSHSRCSTRMMR
jgi:hypothetical protein